MTTRHEFLQQLHELRKPETYLEIGVQHGWSLQLSSAKRNYAIDPEPQIGAYDAARRIGGLIYKETSDAFFADPEPIGQIDLAFIDGMHLAEFAWRDFLNIARYCNSKSIVVFDDVLPTTQAMASRQQCPGDWTGDVWKVTTGLQVFPELVLQLVDTHPTGVLVVTGFESNWRYHSDTITFTDDTVPNWVLDRRHAWSAPAVIEHLQSRGFGQ